MTATLAVTGWGALCSAGIGQDALAAAFGERPQWTSVDGLFDEPLPSATAATVPGFNARKQLGRKGTLFFDRATGLALAACGQALADSGLAVDDDTRERIGVTLGTTAGSLRSSCDYSRETLVQDPPYMVNPALFPNTVMNCAAGQAAIWFGLKGVNTTVAAGQVAFLNVLKYAANMLHNDYADAVLAGAVEEYTPASAWLAHHGSDAVAGEGAAVFVVEPAHRARAAGRPVSAEVLGIAVGFGPEPAALAGCVRRALDSAGADPREVTLVATGAPAGSGDDDVQRQAVRSVLGAADRDELRVKELFGECQSAAAALQTAGVLAAHRDDPARDGGLALVTARTPEGGVGAAVLRGWSRARGDHG
jgi:3-oxoacyl-[acyl-carrier-protein] synthase II